MSLENKLGAIVSDLILTLAAGGAMNSISNSGTISGTNKISEPEQLTSPIIPAV